MIEFAQPLALWTGLLIGLPILAHLAYRRIAHKIPFSSLRFLRTSTIPRSGRKKPSDLMLLLFTGIVFCLFNFDTFGSVLAGTQAIRPESTG